MAEGEVLDWRIVHFYKRYKRDSEGIDDHVQVWRRIADELYESWYARDEESSQ